jgi:hypothetical protein
MRRRMGRPGLVGTMARTAVVAGTATAVVGAVSGSKQAQAQGAAAQQNAAAQSQAQMAEMQAQMDQMNAAQAAAAQQEAIDKAVADALAAKEAAAAPAAAAPAAGGGDTMAELQKLVDLKSQGLLTDEEFAAMKSKLLGT